MVSQFLELLLIQRKAVSISFISYVRELIKNVEPHSRVLTRTIKVETSQEIHVLQYANAFDRG
jgi:hypothetical protein